MSVVTIMMGSEKDMDFASIIIKKLNELEIENQYFICSAHKNTMQVLYNISELDSKKKNIIITIAGMSNALSGVVSANTTFPVIACPPFKDNTDLQLNINSTLICPSKVPVMTILEPENVAISIKKIFNI